MTREEAIEILNFKGLTSIIPFVEHIYNSFERRICKNCKHNNDYNEECTLLELRERGSGNEYLFDTGNSNKFNQPEGFGCTRFEEKQ